jgi:hypothetical protein
MVYIIGAFYIFDFRFRILDLKTSRLDAQIDSNILIQNLNSKIQNQDRSITPVLQHFIVVAVLEH